MGDAKQTRLPGDVGLAKSSILIPFWKNIALTQGVKPNRYGNVPTSFMGRLGREAAGNVSKRRKKNAWGTYKGPIRLDGVMATAYIARPPTARAEPTDDGYAEKTEFRGGRRRQSGSTITNLIRVPRVVSIGKPRILMLEVARATYKPKLQTLFNKEVDRAISTIPSIMQAQLEDNLNHVANRRTRA